MRFRRVLALSPHPDDAELGAGGTIARLSGAGAAVRVVRLSACEESLGKSAAEALSLESVAALAALECARGSIEETRHTFPVRRFDAFRQEVLEALIQERKAWNPDLVLLHASGDVHQDHAVVHAEAVRAFRGCTVLGYETPWSNRVFAPTLHVTLASGCVEQKITALACYKTQAARSYMDPEVTRGLARVRGMQVCAEYAEAFEVIRAIA